MHLVKALFLIAIISLATASLPTIALAETGAILETGQEHGRSSLGCITIPDNGGQAGRRNRNDNITGAPAGAVITSVVVKYDINHPCRSDLIVEISTERAGVWYDHRLWNREGGCTNDIHETDTVWTKFDGLDPNGTWYLVAWDNAAGDEGCIDDFEIWVNWYKPDPLPDLIVQDISISPSSPTEDQQVTITATLKNVGTGDAGPFHLRYYVDGNPIGEDACSFGLNPGERGQSQS